MKHKKTNNNLDLLMPAFIRSMDEFANNGTLKKPDQETVIILAKHYIRQCDPLYREQLIRRIIMVLTVKYHYQNTEKLLSFDSVFEKRIIKKIRDWVKNHSEKSVRMVGLAFQWSFSFSSRLVRSYVEPAVTQTVLTCSLIVNPVLPTLQPKTDDTKHTATASTKEIVHTGKTAVSPGNQYAELQYVKWYSDALLDKIGQESNDWRNQKNNKAITGKLRTVDRAVNDITLEKSLPEKSWYLNIERRRMEPAKAKASAGNTASIRKVRELRPQSEIHTVLTENDCRFRNCFKPFKSRISSELIRLPVRFDITPAGNVSNIVIGKSKVNKDLVQRMTIQLLQLRFSKIEMQLGDQTVYHTFFY